MAVARASVKPDTFTLRLQVMPVNEEDVASGGSDQNKWHIPYCLAHGDEEPGERLQGGAISQVERGAGHVGVVQSRDNEHRRSRGDRRRPEVSV